MEFLGRKFKLISQQIKYRIDKEMEAFDITFSQMQVLRFLENHEGEKITQKILSNEFDVKHSTMAGILQRMQEKDLIYIEVDKENKKYKNIYRSEKAKKIKEQIGEYIKSTEGILVKDFTESEVELIHKLLDKIHNNLIGDK